MKWIDYREKLGIGFDDNAKFVMLKNKILNYLNIIFSKSKNETIYTPEEYFDYMNTVCEKSDNNNPYYGLTNSFILTKNIKELVSKYIAFYNSYSDTFQYNTYRKEQKTLKRSSILKIITTSLNELNIQYEIIKDKDGIFIFPKGAEELDNALVSEPLQWLSVYPLSRKAFVDALKEYSDFNGDNASKIADNFRKALETFFQEFFDKNKALEHYKSEYGNLLKENNVPTELSGNFQTLLTAYTNFNNNYAKHHDKTTQKVLEYILYETGNIIRLMITLKRSQN